VRTATETESTTSKTTKRDGRSKVRSTSAARRTAGKKSAASRRGWSSADISTLRTFAKNRAKNRDSAPWKGTKGIVTQLKRTEGAIRQKAFALGISLVGK